MSNTLGRMPGIDLRCAGFLTADAAPRTSRTQLAHGNQDAEGGKIATTQMRTTEDVYPQHRVVIADGARFGSMAGAAY
jgi:hypothetical protein